MLVARYRKSNSKWLYNKAELLIHARKSAVVNWLSGKAQSTAQQFCRELGFFLCLCPAVPSLSQGPKMHLLRLQTLCSHQLCGSIPARSLAFLLIGLARVMCPLLS